MKHPLPGKKCWDKKCRICDANAKLLAHAIADAERQLTEIAA